MEREGEYMSAVAGVYPIFRKLCLTRKVFQKLLANRGQTANIYLGCVILGENLRAMGIEGWRGKAQDRGLWRRIAQESKAHEGL